MTDQAVPQGWPELDPDNQQASVAFLSSDSVWADHVSESVRCFYENPNKSDQTCRSTQDVETIRVHERTSICAAVQIKIIPETLNDTDSDSAAKSHPNPHPAAGQRGLFAKNDLEPHAFVLDYRGLIHLDLFSDPDSDYCVHLHDDVNIDATTCGNEARFINDFRGISDRPNVAFDAYRDAQDGHIRMGVFVLGRRIKKGNELLVTYGRDFWKLRGIQSNEPDWNSDWDE